MDYEIMEARSNNASGRILMAEGNFKKVEITRGPFDPGGQPETRTGQPIELGFFAWNIKGGMTASRAVLSDPPRLQNFWEWPSASRLVQLADEIGFDYQVPFGRWLGQGGDTDFNGAALDFAVSAAATAPITKRMGLFSTAHITFRFHPLHIAKIGATIDHISNGRWGLNVVSGYSTREMAAFGLKDPIGHDEAYQMADEFLCLMKYLWSEEERFDFEGKYYQSYGAYLAPKPKRRPRPILMNAGLSETGIDFGTRHCDWIFTTLFPGDTYANRVNHIKSNAAKHGRDVRVATMCWIVVDETDALARATADLIEAEIDRPAVRNFLASSGHASAQDQFGLKSDADEDPYLGLGKEWYTGVALGFGCTRIVGGPRSMAEKIKELHDAGLESLLLCFYDPQKGLHQMQDNVIPVLKKMGLRR
jgi:dimethylsulfone monooxygenase